mgnify:CR=1 FL=1
MLLAAQNNIKVEFLTPLQIKQIITGYGQADKKSVQKMISDEMDDAFLAGDASYEEDIRFVRIYAEGLETLRRVSGPVFIGVHTVMYDMDPVGIYLE